MSKENLQFRAVEAPPPRCTWCANPEDRFIPADLYHDSLQPYGSSFIHASLAWLGLWFKLCLQTSANLEINDANIQLQHAPECCRYSLTGVS